MGFVIVLILLLVFMYLLLIRPQRQQQRRHQELLSNLKIGDEVITAGGIYGDVSAIEDEKVHVMIAEDVEIEVARRSIANVVPPEPSLEKPAEDSAELEPAEGEQEPVGSPSGGVFGERADEGPRREP